MNQTETTNFAPKFPDTPEGNAGLERMIADTLSADDLLVDAPKPQEEGARFCIDSDRSAEWLLRKLANIEAEKARVRAQAETICEQLTMDETRLRFLFQPQLEAYARAKMAANGNRRRSVAFLQGTVAFRTVPASLRVGDAQVALSYVKETAPALVKTVESLDAAGYGKLAARHLEETGELLPGVEQTEERESVKISFGK